MNAEPKPKARSGPKLEGETGGCLGGRPGAGSREGGSQLQGKESREAAGLEPPLPAGERRAWDAGGAGRSQLDALRCPLLTPTTATTPGRADLQPDEVRQLRALRQVPAVPGMPAGRGRGAPPAGAWLRAPGEPRRGEEGEDAGAPGRAGSQGGSSPDPPAGPSSAPQPALCPQKPKLKPGKSLPLGVEELGQLPPPDGACGRPLRKSFRRGETRPSREVCILLGSSPLLLTHTAIGQNPNPQI